MKPDQSPGAGHCHLDGIDDVVRWLADGRLGILAFNNHAPEIAAMLRLGEVAKYAQRMGLEPAEMIRLAEAVLAREAEVPAGCARLAAAARGHDVIMLSHDDPDPATRRVWRALGCLISEFPKTEATAAEARGHGEAVVFGAPNVVRGGSHNKSVSAAHMVAARLCDVLGSDYYYPAQLVAAFRLARDGILPLHEAWKLVSRNAAQATGLDDRGLIADGRRADLVLVDDRGPVPRVVTTIAAGRIYGLDSHGAPSAPST